MGKPLAAEFGRDLSCRGTELDRGRQAKSPPDRIAGPFSFSQAPDLGKPGPLLARGLVPRECANLSVGDTGIAT